MAFPRSFYQNFLGYFYTGGVAKTTYEWIGLQSPRRTTHKPNTSSVLSNHSVDAESPIKSPRRTHWKRCAHVLHLSLKCFASVDRAWNSRFPAWRGGVAAFTTLALLVLVFNVSMLIWAVRNLDQKPFATITMRSCKSVEKWAAISQGCITVFSTVLLSSSNYCIQVLCSPTRDEVDKAHAAHKYLHIGILSVTNILRFRKRRLCLFILLVFTNIPLRLVYKSAIMTGSAAQRYNSVFATRKFVDMVDCLPLDELITKHRRDLHHWECTIPPWKITHNMKTPMDPDSRHLTPQQRLGATEDSFCHRPLCHCLENFFRNKPASQQLRNTSRWEPLTRTECIKHYLPIWDRFPSDRGSVIIVIDHLNTNGTQLKRNLYYADQLIRDGGHPIKGIKFCLSLRVPFRCRLQVHIWWLIAIILFNISKIICMVLTLREQAGKPLMTLGDAIASFLERPCPRTSRLCLHSAEEIDNVLKARRKAAIAVGVRENEFDEDDEEMCASEERPRVWKKRTLRYHSSMSNLHYQAYTALCGLTLSVTMYYLQQVKKEKAILPNSGKAPTFWDVGLGKIHRPAEVGRVKNPYECLVPSTPYPDEPEFVRALPKDSPVLSWAHRRCPSVLSRLAFVMLCASPQLIVSVIDLALNQHITYMIQLRDWRRLSGPGLALRVSNPEPGSQQNSTYWLSLPYRYSVPQILASALLSWLVSSSLILFCYQWYEDNGDVSRLRTSSFLGHDQQGYIYRIYYSGLAILCSLLVGAIILAVSLGIGFQRCLPGPPLGPSNSFVVAAACHPPENDRDAARKLVRWGVVPSQTDTAGTVRHCTITSHKVEPPVEGTWYA